MSWKAAQKHTYLTTAIRAVLPIFIVHLLIVITAGTIWQYYFGTLSKTIVPSQFGVFTAGLSHWDATWFLLIAKHGYLASNPSEAAFFPLFPAAMGIVGRLFITIHHFGLPVFVGDRAYFFGGILVSNLSFFITLAGLYKIGQLKFTVRQTTRGLWLLALFPSSYYFSAAYSEAIFLMFAVLGFLFGYRRQWLWASICIGLASLTRDFGIFGVPCLLWLVWQDFRAHRNLRLTFWNAMQVSLIPAFSLGIYLMWLNHVYHNPLAFMQAEDQHWHRNFSWIWTSLQLDYHQDPLGFIVSVLFIILLVMSVRFLPFELWLFSACMLLIPMFSIAGRHNPYPMSMIRFVLVAFPIFLFLGAKLRKLETYFAVMITCTVFLTWLTGLFASAHWIA